MTYHPTWTMTTTGRILFELDRISSTVNIIRRELFRLEDDGCYDNNVINKDLIRKELEFYELI